MYQYLKAQKANLILGAVILLIVIALAVMNAYWPAGYVMYETDGISYDSGVVVDVRSESVEPQSYDSNRYLGTQVLAIHMRTGFYKGQVLEIQNDLSTTHNIFAHKGDTLIVKVDRPENAEPYFSIYNFDRKTGLILIIALFAGLMIVIGRRKGFKSVLGLAFTLYFIVMFLLPMLYHGRSPILYCLVTVLVTVPVCLLLVSGFSKKTLVAAAATILGVVVAILTFALFSVVLHIRGYNLEEAEDLLLIAQDTGLKVSSLLFVGVVIASLGAVIDMTMSITTSLFEMKRLHPALSAKEIFASGMAIGSDMVGTMCETLVLAFTGTSITTLLVLIAYGVQVDQLLSSDYIAIEVAHAITGSVAVVLSVPITAWLAAGFSREMKKPR